MQEKVKEILSQLVQIDTTTTIDTLEAVKFVEEYLKEKGIESLLVYNEDKSRASLIATIGNPNNAGVILSGHLDSVSVRENEWKTNPFELHEEDEKYYGRGACAMKGAIACVLAMIDDIKESGKTFHLVLTHDEASTLVAITQLIKNNFYDYFKKTPLGCIVMEPSKLKPIFAHKGAHVAEITVIGKTSHSAYPSLGVDALFYLVETYNFAQAIFLKDSETFMRDDKFSPPVSTFTVTQMQGGDAHNKVPGTASLIFSGRSLPNDDIKNMISKIKSYVEALDRNLKMFDDTTGASYKLKLEFPPFETNKNSEFIKDFYKKAQTDEIIKVSYGTEAGYFQKAGINTIIFGPGSIENGFKTNEFIEVEQLDKFCEFIKTKLL